MEYTDACHLWKSADFFERIGQFEMAGNEVTVQVCTRLILLLSAWISDFFADDTIFTLSDWGVEKLSLNF